MGLQVLSSFPSLQHQDSKQLEIDIQNYFSRMRKVYVTAISLYDERGNVIYSTDAKTMSQSFANHPLFFWTRRKENRGRVSIFPLPSHHFRFLLAMPVYQIVWDATYPTPSGKYAGALFMTTDLGQFLANELKVIDPDMDLQQIWMMEGDGSLLFQNEHHKTLGQPLDSVEKGCNFCHPSFKYIEKIKQRKQGTVDYHVEPYPTRLAAFAPIELKDISWIVVLKSTYEQIEAYGWERLKGHLILLGTVIFALVGASALINRNYKLKVKAEQEVKHLREKEELEDKIRQSEKQLRYLSSRLLTAQEEERRRMSRELHDELGQSLAVLKLQLRFIERNLQADQKALKEECERNLEYIDQVIEEVRRLSRDLTPSLLEDLGLSAALRWLIHNFTQNDHIQVSLDMREIDHLFPLQAQIIIYRIFQEILTNIGKHAQATQLSVIIKHENGVVSFSIEDNGMGFDMKEVSTRGIHEKGLGLTIMDERVQMLRGSMKMDSQEGQGTRVTFTVPVEKGVSS
jgi:signal transduction histidine kinase